MSLRTFKAYQLVGDFGFFREVQSNKRAANFGYSWQCGNEFVDATLPAAFLCQREMLTQSEIEFVIGF